MLDCQTRQSAKVYFKITDELYNEICSVTNDTWRVHEEISKIKDKKLEHLDIDKSITEEKAKAG